LLFFNFLLFLFFSFQSFFLILQLPFGS
jgi:hypothetical protein